MKPNRTHHPATAEQAFSTEAVERFSSQIMLSDHKTSANKFQKTEIIQSMGKKVQRKKKDSDR